MILNNDRAVKVAEFLLQIKAVKLQPKNPFTWASGWKSPIYCDNRVTLSYPNIRTFIRQNYSDLILDHFGKPDVIAGVATGGIAQGALVAEELGLPFIYVRSSPKGHGMGNQIEGHFEEGQKVIVIEDLISTGGSSLKAVEALREAKLDVKGLVAIFTYGFEVAENNFKEAKCPFVTLTNYDVLLEKALHDTYISKDDVESLKEWKINPSQWMQ
ncbi:orotate phosphoribosyltransferase [Crocinitomicaceae bacterium CZZ-1]|uniref:Orotate phosphoribosyltransferase n=1 Tax=Taishania pollutisoli TaxID=2766479 RepID=A0A8J6P8E9_9FLAO|nr:orotate phosphoribosyltransferase [Taishania pollutisoli]MBC9812001.1 orotate phosphoribosyltransferase [Taishania pollutisoli]MBX2949923.1 orotate phosphoribosyltransferase [Crocinitomicaceae bacterium]NGF74842.1 orotate phosphoribosyltransferase [Fluviicola sp. SGL-29]